MESRAWGLMLRALGCKGVSCFKKKKKYINLSEEKESACGLLSHLHVHMSTSGIKGFGGSRFWGFMSYFPGS